MAQDSSLDLSAYNFDALCGFGLPDFQPVTVPAGAVARCIRWQCCCFDGSFDWRQYNEDRPFYLRRVELADLTAAELAGIVAPVAQRVLEGGAA